MQLVNHFLSSWSSFVLCLTNKIDKKAKIQNKTKVKITQFDKKYSGVGIPRTTFLGRNVRAIATPLYTKFYKIQQFKIQNEIKTKLKPKYKENTNFFPLRKE